MSQLKQDLMTVLCQINNGKSLSQAIQTLDEQQAAQVEEILCQHLPYRDLGESPATALSRRGDLPCLITATYVSL